MPKFVFAYHGGGQPETEEELVGPEMEISRAGKVDPPERTDVIAVPQKARILPSWARTYIPSSNQVRDALRRARQKPTGVVVAGADTDD